ncbi:RNA-directed DNA polymerase, eukaryota, reverse transcriptase zinc-binding domain protein [Tanacetum coccineum]
MGDSEWIEVRRKKHGSVFNRLKFPQPKATMVDDLAKISLSVYVSNFPSHLTVRELWNICGKKETLVDVFIANHKNKLEQMFGFCRFIKFSLLAMFLIPTRPHRTPNDFPLTLLGCYKEFCSITNIRTMCHTEGFLEVDFKYLGGLWVLLDFTTKDTKDKFFNHKGVNSWFSTLKPWHDDFVVEERHIWLEIEGCNRLSKRLCIKSSHALLVFASILMTLNNVTYAIWVRELYSWTPTFIGNDYDSDEANSIGMYEQPGDKLFGENYKESVVEIMDDIGIGVTDHEQEMEVKAEEPVTGNSDVHDGLNNFPIDNDPFRLCPLINKKTNKASNLCQPDTPEFPPGFSPINDDHQAFDSTYKLFDGDSLKQPGFSLLEKLEETIKVDLALGLNMEGCDKTLASLIVDKGGITVNKLIVFLLMLKVDLWMLRQVWGNTHFDFSSTSARGMSGAIWDGTLVMIRDFNEVLDAGERYGLVFNDRQVKFFNEFINDASLIDTPLGGFNYTWTDKWGSKMNSYSLKKDHQKRLSFIDAKIGHGNASEEDFKNHRDSLTFLGVLDRIEAKDLAQKAKIKWALEGDENTSFFHGCNSSFIALIPKVSNAKFVSDFRPMSLIGCQYKIIGKLLANRLSTVIGDCISHVQSAFIKGRNILDGPLILNEVLAWYRQRKKELMVFKVNFEKTFESLRWDFLDIILDKLGFGLKWRAWIKGCLHNARSSVLVNGSPTKEFELFRGLRQGDPMSPFLFILAMEGLHALTCKAEALGLFKGVGIY